MIFYVAILERCCITKNSIKIDYFSKILGVERRVSNINKPINTVIFHRLIKQYTPSWYLGYFNPISNRKWMTSLKTTLVRLMPVPPHCAAKMRFSKLRSNSSSVNDK